MTAVLLGLLTALLFGTAAYLGPVLGRDNSPAAVLAFGQVGAVLAAGLLVSALGSGPPGGRSIVFGLLAGVANGLALAAMFESARHLRLSVMAPIGAAGGALPVVVALLLGERPAVWQLAGIPLALLGVVLVAAGQHGGSGVDPPGGRRSHGLWLAAAWAVLYGVFLTLFAEAVASGGPGLDGEVWAVLTSRITLLATVVVARRSPLRLRRSAIPLVTLNGLLILGGVTAFAAATSAGLVSVVSVLATLSPLVTVALAVVLLRERLGGSQQAGLATATAGVVLLAAG